MQVTFRSETKLYDPKKWVENNVPAEVKGEPCTENVEMNFKRKSWTS